jgi:hypothetical protein
MTTTNRTAKRRAAMPMSLELLGVLEYRRTLFERKFGRPPRRGEPLFFDPRAETPTRLPAGERGQALAEVAALAGLAEPLALDLVDRW